MEKIYSEDNITWSTIEKYIPYAKVIWTTNKQGISTYKLLDKNGKEIDIDEYVKRYISFEDNS